MRGPDYLPLAPGLRLEYRVRRAQEVRTLVVEQFGAAEGAVLVRRTWTSSDGSVESETSRRERRGDGVYEDGEKVLPLPDLPGAAWSRPPRAYRVAARDAEAKTPAGDFADCLRVTYLIAAGDAGGGERLYASGVGLVRETCSDEADPFEILLTGAAR